MGTAAEKKIRRFGADMTEGNVFPKLIRFVLPLMLSNLVQQLYSTVDLVIVGNVVGNVGLVSVSTGSELVVLFTAFAMGFTGAGQTSVAQLYGAKDFSKLKNTIGTQLSLMTSFSLAFMVIALLFNQTFLTLLKTPVESFETARNYLMITALGMPFIYGYNAICGILRGIGESLWPLLLIIVAAITNVGLDLLMVAGLGMGAAGAAIATVLAQALSFSVAFVLFCRKSNSLYFELKLSSFAMKRHEALALLKYGIPMAAQTTLIHLSQLFCISFVNAYGLVAASVNGIGNNIIRFCTIYTSSINNGAAVVVGQNLGAKKYERIREIVTSGLLITSSIAVVCCLFCLLIPRQIFGFFTSDTTVLDYSAAFLRTAAISFTLGAWHAPFGAVVTGSGNARLNLIVGLLDGIVLRIGISFFLVYAMDMGVMGFFYGNALARLAPCIICTAYYFSGRWKNRALMME